MKLQKIIILLLALFLMRWDMSVANSETTQPPPDESDATAETVSYSTFLGEWEATEGSSRFSKGGYSIPLKTSESSLKILVNPHNDKVVIDFRLYYEDEYDTRWHSIRDSEYEVERSALQGALPKTIEWQEADELTRSGVSSNTLFLYTLEIKDSNTISLSVFDIAAKASAVFKLSK